jgi:hypothetical protein
VEAVAEGFAARAQAQRLDRHHLLAVQRDQAVRRAHELNRRHPVGQLVAHRFADRKAPQRPIQRRLQPRGQRHACPHARVHQRFLLAVGFTLQPGRLRRDAQRVELLGECRCCATLRVQPDRNRHQLLAKRHGRAAVLDRRQQHPQAPRRAEDVALAQVVRDQLRPDQLVGDLAGERLAQRLQRLRRQLLGVQLHQQRRVHAPSRSR